MTIIANKRNKDNILKILYKEKIYKELDNLACLSTTIPISAIDMDNCITCSSLRCSSPDRNLRNLRFLTALKNFKILDDCVQNVLQATQFSVAGYFYLITRAFAWEDITIIKIVSTFTELNLIIKEEDVPKAFTLFREAIINNS